MKNCYLHLLLLIVTLSFFACNPQREASDLLLQVQSLVDTQPEKALQLIDSIRYPERSLNRRQYMSYLVTRVQARHRNFLPVENETFIFIARDYFARRNNDARQTALAFFYSGCVYEEQGNFESAMQHFNQAAEYAARANDAYLQGLIHFYIGDVFTNAGLHLEALQEFKKSERFFANSFSDRAISDRVHIFSAIGRMYFLLGQQNSAFAAFRKGLELAKGSGNNELLGLLHQNIHLNYFRIGEYENAEKHLRLSFELNEDAMEISRYYLNFARLFKNTNQTDSLNLYIDKLRQAVELSDDLFFKVAVYNFLATEARARNDFEAAFEYQQKDLILRDRIYRKRLQQSVYEARQRFNYQRLQYEYTQALLARQRLGIYFLILCFIASLLVAFIYRRMVHQRNRMLTMQNVINSLKQTNNNLLASSKPTDNQQLSKAMMWKFDTQLKALFIKKGLDGDKKASVQSTASQFCRAIFGVDNPNYWDVLVAFVEEVYPGAQAFLKNKNLKLSDTEYKVAILSFTDLRAKEIGDFLGKTTASINITRTSIRKKMNLMADTHFPTLLKQAYFVSNQDCCTSESTKPPLA